MSDSTSVPLCLQLGIFPGPDSQSTAGERLGRQPRIRIAAFSADDAVELGVDAPQAKRREQLARGSASDSEAAGLSGLHPLGLGCLMSPSHRNSVGYSCNRKGESDLFWSPGFENILIPQPKEETLLPNMKASLAYSTNHKWTRETDSNAIPIVPSGPTRGINQGVIHSAPPAYP